MIMSFIICRNRGRIPVHPTSESRPSTRRNRMCPLTPEQLAEVERGWAANRAFQAELSRKRRMETGELEIELVPGTDDPQEDDPTFQNELNVFSGRLRAGSVVYSQSAVAFDAIDGQGYPLAEFAIRTLGPPAIGIVTAAVTGWLAGRAGRKARLKFGDIEAEARTPEEVERLLRSAAAFRDSKAQLEQVRNDRAAPRHHPDPESRHAKSRAHRAGS